MSPQVNEIVRIHSFFGSHFSPYFLKSSLACSISSEVIRSVAITAQYFNTNSGCVCSVSFPSRVTQVYGAALSICHPEIAPAWPKIWNRTQLSRSINLGWLDVGFSPRTSKVPLRTPSHASRSSVQYIFNGGGVTCINIRSGNILGQGRIPHSSN